MTTDEVRPIDAFATSVRLSILFLVVYGGCNWITAQRSDIATFYFEWERSIPFVPFMVVPYLSIDLFFVAAPFLCRSERELRTFSQRITAAIIVAGICFLVLPLRFGFARPNADGWIGLLFDWFRAVDAPFNLFPSLHAALWLLLAQLYWRHLRGVWRAAAMVWFALIGLSPMLTHQHHVIDIVGGLALAISCVHLFREDAPRSPLSARRRVGSYYATSAVILSVLAGRFWPWGALLIWPGVALGIVALAYFWIGALVFCKRNGRLSLGTKVLLGPLLFGQYFSLLYYRRQCRPWDAVTPQVWIGRKLNEREARRAVQLGVTAVLDLSAEFSEARPFRSLIYNNIPILDLTAPTPLQLSEIMEFLDEHSPDGIVYVHCKIGYSRSAAAVAAYLLGTGRAASVQSALAMIRNSRPSIIIRPEIVQVLAEWSILDAGGGGNRKPFVLASDFAGLDTSGATRL